MVEARLAATDGYGRRGFDVRTMERMLDSFANYGAKLVTKQLAAACDSRPLIVLPSGAVVDVRSACPVMRDYRGTGRLVDPGAWLFTTWVNDIPTGIPWLDRFDPSNPLNTPRVLDPNPTPSTHLARRSRSSKRTTSRLTQPWDRSSTRARPGAKHRSPAASAASRRSTPATAQSPTPPPTGRSPSATH